MAVQNIPDYTFHGRLLAGERLPIDANEPAPGYYRLRLRPGGVHLPIAYWYDSRTAALRCHLDGKDLPEQRALELWPYAAKNPVSGNDYYQRCSTGKWPGEHDAVIGHNIAPPDDDAEAIGERIEDLAREAEKLLARGAATTAAACDQASDLANTLGELEGKCSKLHTLEKAPHLEAGRAIDRHWFPLRDHAAEIKTRLKRIVITPFLMRRQMEADAAAQAAIAAGAEPPQTRITAGSSKRSTALRTVTSAEVTDWELLLAALAEHPDIRECAQRIANAAAKSGVALPGSKIVKVKVAA